MTFVVDTVGLLRFLSMLFISIIGIQAYILWPVIRGYRAKVAVSCVGIGVIGVIIAINASTI